MKVMRKEMHKTIDNVHGVHKLHSKRNAISCAQCDMIIPLRDWRCRIILIKSLYDGKINKTRIIWGWKSICTSEMERKWRKYNSQMKQNQVQNTRKFQYNSQIKHKQSQNPRKFQSGGKSHAQNLRVHPATEYHLVMGEEITHRHVKS